MSCTNVVLEMNAFQKKAIIAYRMRKMKENDRNKEYREFTIKRVKEEFSSIVKVPFDKLSIDIKAIEFQGMNMTFEYNKMIFFATRSVSTDIPMDFVDIFLIRECPRCGILINQPVDSLERLGQVLMTPLSKEHFCSIPIVASGKLKSLFEKISRIVRR